MSTDIKNQLEAAGFEKSEVTEFVKERSVWIRNNGHKNASWLVENLKRYLINLGRFKAPVEFITYSDFLDIEQGVQVFRDFRGHGLRCTIFLPPMPHMGIDVEVQARIPDDRAHIEFNNNVDRDWHAETKMLVIAGILEVAIGASKASEDLSKGKPIDTSRRMIDILMPGRSLLPEEASGEVELVQVAGLTVSTDKTTGKVVSVKETKTVETKKKAPAKKAAKKTAKKPVAKAKTSTKKTKKKPTTNKKAAPKKTMAKAS
ncbi:hypothetical protein LCGC14_0147120 [marine sediment metagenome]|uniref:Uncharacterized protein n=1 Tax=marine sediment metagenome TaxID=412755 RepID=A0A0F9V052_9ZZZZ